MLTWTLIAGLSAVFVSLGTAFDRLMLRRQKVALHTSLVSWWVRVHEASLRDLSRDAANRLRAIINVFPENKRWLYVFISSIVISALITTLAQYAGELIDFDGHFEWRLPMWLYYVINYLFDLLTVLVTYKLVGIVARGNMLQSLLAICTDAFLALVLAVTCLFSLTVAADYVAVVFDERDRVDYVAEKLSDSLRVDAAVLSNDITIDAVDINYLQRVVRSAEWLTALYHLDPDAIESDTVIHHVSVRTSPEKREFSLRIPILPKSWWGLVVSASTLIPTILFLSLLVIALFAKFTIVCFRRAALHLLELITEIDPQSEPEKFVPATLLGLLFGVLTVTSKAVVDLLKIIEGN
jgi:hypothetical protein